MKMCGFLIDTQVSVTQHQSPLQNFIRVQLTKKYSEFYNLTIILSIKFVGSLELHQFRLRHYLHVSTFAKFFASI